MSEHTFTQIDFDPFAGRHIEKVASTIEPQKEIWLSCIMGGNDANLAYNESISLKLQGKFDFESFKKALSNVVKRHEALRSTISSDGESVFVYNDIPFVFDIQDISSARKEEQDKNFKEFIHQEMNNPFDLQEGPLVRFFLHKLADTTHVFTLFKHHIIGDGWSTGIILEDISKMYNAYRKGEDIQLPYAPQLSEYAAQQLVFNNSNEYKAILNYWRNLYRDNVPVLDLPTDRPRESPRSYKGNRYDYPIDKDNVAKIKATGAKSGCSLVNTLLSAFEIFLYLKTKQEDIVVGLPASGQSATGNFGLVGHCVNLMPLRSKIDPSISFIEYLKKRKSAFFDAYDNQRLTFGELVKQLNIKRDSTRIPLVPVVFNIDMGMDNSVVFDDVLFELISNPREYETFEIFLNATGSKGALILEWSYNAQLFNPETIRKMMKEFEYLLQSLTKKPDQQIKDIKLEDDSELKKQISQWNDTFISYPKDKPVTALISEAAARFSEKTAIRFGKRKISYKNLEETTNRLAGLLIKNGVVAGDIVGIAVDRSAEMLLSMIAVLKAGAAYVPLDPEYPQERVEFMLSDSSAKVMLTSAKYKGRFLSNASELIVEEIWPKLSGFPATNPAVKVSGNDLAYILYTSGSTGKPKGVQIEQHSFVNFLLSMQQSPGINAEDRVLAITTISFDISGLELFLPLISGAELVIADTDSAKDARFIKDLLVENDITFMQATPSTWRMMIESGWNGTKALKILCGGEALPKELASKLSERCAELWNVYGPTETTVWSTIKHIASLEEPITVGRPIANTQVYILDENLNFLSAGSTGEIYIGGDGVARGYLNRPELTAERFIKNAESNSGFSKIYRTGDLGRFLENGEILCLGRVDHQVKIRGHRIELGEIEHSLSKQRGIRQAVVIAREDKPGDQRLVAYIVPDIDTDSGKNLMWQDRWDVIYKSAEERDGSDEYAKQRLDTAVLEQVSDEADIKGLIADWLQQSITRIKKLQPRKMVEVGCGTGRLLMELAPLVDSYYATDFSENAIEILQHKIDTEPEKCKSVSLGVAKAEEYPGIKKYSQDLILVHSVVQYFEGIKYLLTVIESAVEYVRDGGCIFLGDLQTLGAIKMHYAFDQLKKTSDQVTVGEFSNIVTRRIDLEEELSVDPAFFYFLPSIIQRVAGVNIQIRQGSFVNEGTKCHYDVWLYVGAAPAVAPVGQSLQWENFSSLEWVEENLTNNPAGVLQIKGIPNNRLIKDHLLVESMKRMDNAIEVKSLKDRIEGVKGIDPDLFWLLGERLNFETHVRWANDGSDGFFEAVFIPKAFYPGALPVKPSQINVESLTIADFIEESVSSNILSLSKDIVSKWKHSLDEVLPAYMVPDEFVGMKKLPLTQNNKIDRKLLPKPETKVSENKTNKLPRTETEKFILQIWENCLEIKDIGIDEDFFEIGGHSLIAVKVMSQIEKQTGKRLPLTSLFSAPTIEKLSLLLVPESKGVVSWNSLMPIKTKGTKPPLYLIHGGGLTLLVFNLLAKTLDDDQPVYGLQPKGLDGIEEPLDKMEDIAAHYIAEILKQNPDGPYAIAGFSFGGLLAFEMGKQLKAMGKEVLMIGMLDSFAEQSDRHDSTISKIFGRTLEFFKKVRYTLFLFSKDPVFITKFRFLTLRMNSKKLLVKLGLIKKQEDKGDFLVYSKKVADRISLAFHNYKLTPYDGTVDLFRAQTQMFYLPEFKYLGWKPLALKGVNVHHVPGDHGTIFTQPNVNLLAKALQNCLNDNMEKRKGQQQKSFLKVV